MDQLAYAQATIHTNVSLPKFDTHDPRIFCDLVNSISPDEKTKFLTALSNLPYKAVEKAKHLLMYYRRKKFFYLGFKILLNLK